MLIPWFMMSWMTWSPAEAETLSLGIRPANSSSVEQAARLHTEFRAIMNSREQLHAQWEEDAYCGALGLVDCLLSRGSDAGVELAIGGELVGSNAPRLHLSFVDVTTETLVLTLVLGVPGGTTGGDEILDLDDDGLREAQAVGEERSSQDGDSDAAELTGFGEDLVQVLIAVVENNLTALQTIRSDGAKAVGLMDDAIQEQKGAVQADLQRLVGAHWELEVSALMEPLAFEKVKERDDMDRPEWQKLGMESADEYLAKEQSGLTLEQWREKYDQVSWSESQSGLLGTRVIRPVVGVGWYSHDLVYDGRYLLDSADLEWQASRAWHGREAGLGAEVGLWLGMGLPHRGSSSAGDEMEADPFDEAMEGDDWDEIESSPPPSSSSSRAKNMEVNVGFGVAPASYTTQVELEIPGDSAYDPQIDEALNLDLIFGARLLYYPSILKPFRPVLGGGVRAIVGPPTPDRLLPTESASLPALPGSIVGSIELMGGFDWVLNPAHPNRFLSVWIPVGLGVMGQSGSVYEAGDVTLLTADPVRTNPRLTVGLELGFGVRISRR